MDQNMNRSDGAYVRILHAAADAPAVDIYVNGRMAASNLNFSDFTNYVFLPADEYEFDVYQAGNSTEPILSGQWNVPKAGYYTAVVFGNLKELDMGYLEDSNGDLEEKQSEVRFIHLFPAGPAVTVIADENIMTEALEYKNISQYAMLQPGMYNIQVIETGSGAPVFAFSMEAMDGYPQSVYITGADIDGSSLLTLVDGKNADSFYQFDYMKK